MKSDVSFSFLSLTYEEQLLIYNKMCNDDLSRMSSTCSSAKKTIEDQCKMLCSRSNYGDSFEIFADNSKISIRRQGKVGKDNYKPFAEDNKLPISVSHLQIDFYDAFLGGELLFFLAVWKPICKSVAFKCYNPPAYLISVIAEMTNTFCHAESISFEDRNGLDSYTLDALKKSQNAEILHVNLVTKDIDGNVFDEMKSFAGFSIYGSNEKIEGLLKNLEVVKQIGNLKKASLFTSPLPHNPGPLILLNEVLPNAKEIFRFNYCLPEGIMSMYKLPVANGICALIEEKTLKKYFVYNQYAGQEFTITFMKNDETVILDYLIEKLQIDKTFFTEEKKKRFLAKGERARDYELKTFAMNMKRF